MRHILGKVISTIKIIILNIRNNATKIGLRNSYLASGVTIECRKGGSLIAKGLSTGRYVHIATSGSLVIGFDVYINRNSIIVCHESISIGNGSIFGPNVCIYDHDHKISANGKEKGFNCSAVMIGNNCWIGAGAIILRGTILGDNCVVGAGTVVQGNIPSNSLVISDRSLTVSSLKGRS